MSIVGTHKRRIGQRAATIVIGIVAAGLVAGCAVGGREVAASADGARSKQPARKISIGLIIKMEANPFFVKMKSAARAAADEAGAKLLTAAGKSHRDNASQVAAIDRMISQGVRGILITPNETKAIVPAIERARDAGVLVIALDTPTEPPDATDAVLGTNNFKAGLLIGRWAKAKFEADGKLDEARIAMLDINGEQASVEVQRDQGFLKGFGVDVGDVGRMFDEDDARIVGHGVTDGLEDGGRTAMEGLLRKDPGVNLVYTVNELSAAGAYAALEAAGKQRDVTIVSVDGGCQGVRNVSGGTLAATAQQYPRNMAEMGVKAVVDYAESDERISGYTDTGVELITDDPLEGVPSKDSAYGLENCWG